MRNYKIFWILFAIGLLAITTGAATNFFPVRKQTARDAVELQRLTLADPLFWDSSLDPASFDRAIKNLEAAEVKLADLASRRGMEGERTLYWGIAFLATLPDVGRSQAAFMKMPTAANGSRLLSAYDKALAAYQNETNRLESASQQYLDAKRPEFEEIRLNLPLLRENAAVLSREIERRKNCLREGICDVRWAKLPEMKAPLRFPPRLPEALLFPQSAEQIEKLGLVRIPSSCWDFTGLWHEFYVGKRIWSPTEHALVLKIADNNIYLRTLPPALMQKRVSEGLTVAANIELNDLFLRADLPLVFVNDSWFELCSDLSPYPRSVTLLWLKDELTKNGNSMLLGINEEKLSQDARPYLEMAKTASQNISASDAPSWDEAVRLESALRALLELYSRHGLDLPVTAMTDMARLRSAIASSLPRFDEVVDGLAGSIRHHVLTQWRILGIPDVVTRLNATNYLSLTYLAFSNAAWRVEAQPIYLGKALSIPKSPVDINSISDLGQYPSDRLPLLVLYSRIKHLFTPTKIIDITKRSFDIGRAYLESR